MLEICPILSIRIRERVTQMNDAWEQTAKTTGLWRHQPAAIRHEDQNGNNDRVRGADGGIKGDPDDHPLVDAMGFVRDSQRKSGLTRGKKESKPPTT